MTEFCANKKTSAPSPSPFPLFSPWAGQLLSSLPMGEKRGKGEGDGAVFVAAHTVGSPDSCQCKQKFVQNPGIVLAEKPVTTVGWWCVVVCAKGRKKGRHTSILGVGQS